MSIGAFFDLDGTLLGPPSLERRFLRDLRWRGALGPAHGARWLGQFFRKAAAGDWRGATAGNKAHLAGVSLAGIDAWIGSLARRPLAFFPAALRRLECHAAQGHRIFLLSGTLEPLAAGVARQWLLAATPCATALEISPHGAFTGRVAGLAVSGSGKLRALKRLAAGHGIDLLRSYAYGNGWGDRWMLARVGFPAAVNPSPLLAALARLRGWPLLRWADSAPSRNSTRAGFRAALAPASAASSAPGSNR